jgi:hypothetical protein
MRMLPQCCWQQLLNTQAAVAAGAKWTAQVTGSSMVRGDSGSSSSMAPASGSTCRVACRVPNARHLDSTALCLAILAVGYFHGVPASMPYRQKRLLPNSSCTKRHRYCLLCVCAAAFPRLVKHVDDGFLAQVTQLYRERIQPGAQTSDTLLSALHLQAYTTNQHQQSAPAHTSAASSAFNADGCDT